MRARTIQICNITNIIRDWIMHGFDILFTKLDFVYLCVF